MSAVMLEDFFKTFVKKPLTDRQTQIIMRGVVAVFGAICVCLVMVVEKLGTVLQLSASLGAVTNGPLLGIFTMGVMVPWVTGLGAIVGGTTGLCVMAWICAKAQAAIASGELSFTPKPVSTQECSYVFIADNPLSMFTSNKSALMEGAVPNEPDFEIYHISYMWYTLFGALLTIIVATAVSFLVGPNDPHEMDPKLLTPFVRRLLRKDIKREEPIGNEKDIRFSSSLDLKAISTDPNCNDVPSLHM